jgi:hypothetical protein
MKGLKGTIMIKSNWILCEFLLLTPLLLCSCATVGIETAKYDVIEKDGNFEIRQYRPQIVAETIVEADFDTAGNIAFRRLFNYISGQNRKKASIDMTAPVNQNVVSEKIKMTSPVNLEKAQDNYVISFLMPSKYSMETLPEPMDSRITLREIPARKIAALRYSGSWSRDRYLSQKALLEEIIQKKELNIVGKDIFARYDPPFHLWFLRRNEVLIPID